MKTLKNIILFALLPYGHVLWAQDAGNLAPDFSLTTIYNTTFQLSAYHNKVVMIYFFGNMCPHCLAGGPSVQSELVEMFNGYQNFVAVGIDTWDGNISSVTAFRDATGLDMTWCIMGSSVASSYNTTYDRLIIIDTEGTIRFKGNMNAAQNINGAKTAIEEALENVTDINPVAYNEKDGLFLWPNPVNGEARLIFKLPYSSEVTVRINSIDGKLVSKEMYYLTSGQNELTLDLSHLQRGIYISELRAGNLVKTAKLIVK